jgi:hypothetical protein
MAVRRRRGNRTVQSLIGLVGCAAMAGFVPASSRTEAHVPDREADAAVRPRVFVLTDIGMDPGDSESHRHRGVKN